MTSERNSGQTNESAKPKKRPSKKILLVAGLLLLAGAGGIGWHHFSRKGAASAAAPALTILHLNNFIVNLADTDRDAYLKIGIDLGVAESTDERTDGDENNSTPKIRDAILSVLTTYHSSDLLTPEGKKQLKQNLLQVLQQRVSGLGIRQVYFTDFLVQR